MQNTVGEVKTKSYDVLLWTPSHRHASVDQPIRTYLQQFCVNTGYSLEDLLGAMDDRDK